MRLHGLEVVTLTLASATYGCATQEVKVGALPSPATSSRSAGTSTSDDGGLAHTPPSADGCDAAFRLCAAYVKTSQVVASRMDTRAWTTRSNRRESAIATSVGRA
jgi:hypothetical protein